MKKVLLGLVIAVMITGSGYAKSSDFFKSEMEKYEQRNWEKEMPIWSYPEQKLEMCSFIHGNITSRLRGPYLGCRNGKCPRSDSWLVDIQKYAIMYNAVCKD